MSLILLSLWWGALALLAYTYLLFPALVFVRGRLSHRPYYSADITPTISLIIAAYNEAGSIQARLENILALDYPPGRLEAIIVSDGSTDSTDALVQAYVGARIKLLALPRGGKVTALNAAVANSTGEILVFSDANTMYAPEALRALVRPFADPEVGGVAGDQHYLPQQSAGFSGAGEINYWNFDRQLKRSQSRAGNTISATGAIYAVRRSLYYPVPSGVIDDFVISTRVIAQGYRLVFTPEAVAYEPVAGSSVREFNRKVRNITIGFYGVLEMRALLNPRYYGFYALQLFSHKVLRRLMVFPLIGLLLISPWLWSHGLIYQAATVLQAGFYGLALMGWVLSNTRLGESKLFTFPSFFCMANLAALLATLNVLRGHRITSWNPQRAPGPSAPRQP